jgi:hypothetical protein
MNDNQFTIFKPRTKFLLSFETILYALLLIPVLLFITTKGNQSFYLIRCIAAISFIFSTIFIIIIGVASYFITERPKGELNGLLELNKNSIKIENNEIFIDEIISIDFRLSDYLGKTVYWERGLQPKRKFGINNFCDIKIKDGELITLQFQQLSKDDLINNREYLIHYYRKGKITFMKLVHILNIGSYENIQKLKEELSQQE